jgi:signal transduction histidine kinase
MADETRAILGEWRASDVELITFPAECAHRCRDWERTREAASTEEPICLIGAQCLREAGPLPRECHKGMTLQTDQCFDLFCERDLLERCIGTSSYIILPGWLRNWQANLEAWGMSQEVARQFFAESIDSIALLVTLPYELMESDLQAFSAYVGRPYIVMEVGLDRYRGLLSGALNETRHQEEVARLKGKLSAAETERTDLAAALRGMRAISEMMAEEEIIAAMLSLLQSLLNPKELRYRPCTDNEGADGSWERPLAAFAVRRGFVAPVAARQQLLGVVEAKEMARPELLEGHLALVTDICAVAGLSISRARAVRELAASNAKAEEMLRLEMAAGELSRLLATKDIADSDYSAEARILGEVSAADRVEILLPGIGPDLILAGSWGRAGPASGGSVGPGGGDLLESVEMLVVRSAGNGSSHGSMMAANVQLQGKAQGLVVLSSSDPGKRWNPGVGNLVTIFARMLAGILERERLNRELLALNDSLHITNKIMRHDIRNELLVTSGALELFRVRKEGRYLDMASDSITRVTRMLDQMKEMEAFLRIGAGLQPFSLREVAEVAMAGNSLPVDVRGEAEVLADHAIYSVLDNLVRNAKVHGQGRNVRILISPGAVVTVRVEDEGRGIPVEAMPHLFEEGYCQGPTQGTGLGLFIVKRTMDRYGGSVHAEHNSPCGTVMVLTFPSPPA